MRSLGIIVLLITVFFLMPQSSLAQSLIRDAEIEETIALYAKPLFRAAGLNEKAVQVYIVNDDRLNAFVSNGQKIFIHTGLLMKTKTPEAVMGVIAHEAGHIAGGHLAKLRSRVDELSGASLISYILGAAAVAGGAGEAGIAILTGGQHLGQQTLLAHTRAQERAADSFAVSTLERVKLPPTGLLETLELLEQQNLWRPSRKDNPYASSHPLNAERVAFVREQIAESPYKDRSIPKKLQQRHDRMRGKLYGFTKGDPGQYFVDNPIAHQYATAVAAYKTTDFVLGDTMLSKLQNQFPDDPYLYELKGQLYLENGGDIKEAVTAYRKALSLRPAEVQLKQGLARGLLVDKQPEKAVLLLKQVVQHEPKNSRAWSQLADAYGLLDQELLALLASTEVALLRGKKGQARQFLDRAEGLLEEADQKTKLHYSDLRKSLGS